MLRTCRSITLGSLTVPDPGDWETHMARIKMIRIAVVIFLAVLGFTAIGSAQKKSDKSITVVFKDGHQKSFAVTDVSRIEFKNDAMVVTHGGRPEAIPVADIAQMNFDSAGSKLPPLGRNHFVGKWEFGEGQNMGSFYVTLDADGQAHKSIGAPHGTWAVVDGEARISWDDGWRDVIRKVGTKHEKFAYEPGKSLSDEPSNVAKAKSLNDQPM